MCPTSSQVRYCSSMEMHCSLLLSEVLHLVMHDALQYRHALHFSLLSECLLGLPNAGENGGRADTRWVTLSNEDGVGLAAVTLGEPLQMNATRWVTPICEAAAVQLEVLGPLKLA